MSDLRPVNQLRARLASALSMRGAAWAAAEKPMAEALKRVQAELGSAAEARPQTDQMVAAVRDFMRHQRVRNFNQLKYVCYGLAVPLDADNTRLIDRKPLFARLLELVSERQDQAKTYRRCYQGLLAGYFGFEHRVDDPAASGGNWLTLRSFLADRLQDVLKTARSRDQVPLWLSTLAEHSNLLRDRPCARYVDALRRGSTTELKNVCTALAIESSSWVWHEAVLAYVIDVVEEKQDAAFKAELRKVLDMVQDTDKDRRLPEAIAKSAAAFLVMRYVRCQDKPEHPLLRDACLSHIGNPWLQRAAWDGVVKDEAARRMVESWLKRGLIRDFFQLLAHDGSADTRRLNYWLKWEPQISDMWFALGSEAQSNRTAAFRSIRERMRGRERRLTGATSGDNAFIMRIGDTYIVEFGLKGTACFVFESQDLPLDLEETEVGLPTLRATQRKLRLIHRGEWEQDFDEELSAVLRASASRMAQVRIPAPAPAPEPPQPTQPRLLSSWRESDEIDPVPAKPAWPEIPPVSSRQASTASARRSPSKGSHKASSPDVSRPRYLTFSADLIHSLCKLEGIQTDDRRARGGAYWILADRQRLSSSLLKTIESMGFREAKSGGFYFSTED